MSEPRGARPSLGVSWVHIACGAFIILWLDVGQAASVMSRVPTIAKIAVLGLWLVLAAARSRPFMEKFAINAWPLPVMIGLTILYSGEVAQASQYAQGFGYLLIAFALLCFYGQPKYQREGRALVGVMACDPAITGIRTLVAVQADPELARYLATTEDKRVAVYGAQSFTGLGGYGLAYSLAAILLLLMFFVARGQGHRGVLGLIVACGLVVLIELAFTTAIVLTITLGLAFLIHDLVEEVALRVLIYAVAFLGWILGFYSAILEAVAGWSVVGTVVSQRLSELATFFSGESTRGSDLGTRLYRWSESIEIFLDSGPLGLAGRTGVRGDTGGHSQWLDMIANYGVLTVLPLLFFVFAWNFCRKRSTIIGALALKRVWLYFIVLGFINPLLFSTIVLTWMFFVPITASWIEDRAPARIPSVLHGASA